LKDGAFAYNNGKKQSSKMQVGFFSPNKGGSPTAARRARVEAGTGSYSAHYRPIKKETDKRVNVFGQIHLANVLALKKQSNLKVQFAGDSSKRVHSKPAYDFRFSSLECPTESIDPEIDGAITSGENRRKLRRILQKVE